MKSEQLEKEGKTTKRKTNVFARDSKKMLMNKHENKMLLKEKEQKNYIIWSINSKAITTKYEKEDRGRPWYKV